MVGQWMDCWGSVTCNHQWDALWAGLVCRVAKHDWKGVAGCERVWGVDGLGTCTADHLLEEVQVRRATLPHTFLPVLTSTT